MSLAWTPSQTLPALRSRPAAGEDRLPLYVSMPVVFGVSAMLWGGLGVAVAWLIG